MFVTIWFFCQWPRLNQHAKCHLQLVIQTMDRTPWNGFDCIKLMCVFFWCHLFRNFGKQTLFRKTTIQSKSYNVQYSEERLWIGHVRIAIYSIFLICNQFLLHLLSIEFFRWFAAKYNFTPFGFSAPMTYIIDIKTWSAYF